MPTQGPIDIGAVRRAHDRFLREQDNWIQDALRLAGEQAELHVRQHSKFKRRSANRSLKDSTRSRIIKVGGGRRLRLTWTKKRGQYDIAELIEYGTRPHVISVGEIGGGSGSTRGKALRFRGRDGRWVFRRRVFHPGTRPYKFGFKAASAANRLLVQRMDWVISNKAKFHFR